MRLIPLLAAGALVAGAGFSVAQASPAKLTPVAPQAMTMDCGGDCGNRGVDAEAIDAKGNDVGSIHIKKAKAGVEISYELSKLPAGFKGFHVHTIGKCEPSSAAPGVPDVLGAFLSSGGHYAGTEGSVHPNHDGDLPPILVGANGMAQGSVVTDRLTMDELLDADGSSFMIHSGPDNFANIPDRYRAGGADDMTKMHGDSGTRMACAPVVKKG